MEQSIRIIQLLSYIAFLPVIFKALQAIDLSTIFKKGHTGEIRAMYIILTVVFTKLVVDFYIEILLILQSIL